MIVTNKFPFSSIDWHMITQEQTNKLQKAKQ